MGAYPGGMTTVFQQAGPARRAAPRAPSPKWHIPQHAPAAAMYECGAVSPVAAADYKIALGRVTSTNPKTPSPSLNVSPSPRPPPGTSRRAGGYTDGAL